MGLLGSVSNVFRSIGYLLTGNLDDLAILWSSNPAAIRATGAAGVKKKQKRLAAIAKALGPQNIQISRYNGEILKKQKRLNELPGLIQGARVKAQEVVNRKGLTPDQAKSDGEVQRYLTLLNTYTTEQKKVSDDIAGLQAKVKGVETRREVLKAQGATLKKEIEDAGAKIEETVASVVSAKEERAVNEMMAGLTSGDNGNQEMSALDKIRERAEGEAAAARDLAGMETTNVEAELMAAGSSANNNDLLGLLEFKNTDTSSQVTPAATEKFPEH